jgi:glycosyltransferase involved in cell wall biosynthesis
VKRSPTPPATTGPHANEDRKPTHEHERPGRDRADAAVERVLAQTSVVIALKDDLRIRECIASIDEEVEIVLALNGTPPALRSVLTQHPRKVVVAEIPDAGNLGAAYNAGIAAASGRYVLLMDSDCLFAPRTIRAMAALVADYPVVKGQVAYGVSTGLISRLIARIRQFDEGDYVSALSPPLMYDRTIADRIGGYHFDPLIHWSEDREFDFRLQMAEIPVLYEGSAVIAHDAQQGVQDLRSYWRYGIGEGIGQELGVFTTPAVPIVWRLFSDLAIVAECSRQKGWLAGAYYLVTLGAFHAGTVWHLLRDPYAVRARYPKTARRVRMWRSIPQHCTALTDGQRERLREQHARAGHQIEPSRGFRERLLAVQATVAASAERVASMSVQGAP